MAIKKVFFSHLKSCVYMFKNGKPAYFINGEYHTDVPVEIDELTAECDQGNPAYFINPEKKEIDTAADPLEHLKQKVIAEYLAAQAAASDPTNDRGSTETTKINVQTTDKLIGSASSDSKTPGVKISK